MRKGFLVTLIVSCVTGGVALAQPPSYYPPAYGPAPVPGYGYAPQPQVLYGGTLQADGPIMLPGQYTQPPAAKQTKTKVDAKKDKAKNAPAAAIFHPLTWFAAAPPAPAAPPAA